MKGFIKFLLFVGVIAAAVYFAYPRVKEMLDERKAEKDATAESGDRPGQTAGPARPEVKPEPKAEPSTAPAAPKPKKPPVSEMDRMVMDLYPMPEIAPLVDLVDNWNAVPERAFPRDVVISAPVEIELRSSTGEVIGSGAINAGETVKALGLSGKVLTVGRSESGGTTGTIDVDETTFKQSIQEGYDAYVKRTQDRVVALRETEKNRLTQMKSEERLASVGWSDGSADVFEPMKVSLRNGELTDRELGDVTKWRWLGKQRVNGGDYDTGLVVTDVQTIFGSFSSEWKALIRNGKVEMWVDPVTGKEKT